MPKPLSVIQFFITQLFLLMWITARKFVSIVKNFVLGMVDIVTRRKR